VGALATGVTVAAVAAGASVAKLTSVPLPVAAVDTRAAVPSVYPGENVPGGRRRKPRRV
jgi:hypothetical protein